MAKLFIGYVTSSSITAPASKLTSFTSGLAWHTDDQTLRSKFEEFGAVDEAVRSPRSCRMMRRQLILSPDRRQGSRYRAQSWLRLRALL